MSAREAMAAPVPQPEPDVITMDSNEDNISVPSASENILLRREPTEGDWMDGKSHSDEEALARLHLTSERAPPLEPRFRERTRD